MNGHLSGDRHREPLSITTRESRPSDPVLASKALLERLDATDAAQLDLDLEDAIYTALADLPTATGKARRDAPDIAVHYV